jgi:hypothetical protein
MRAAPAGALLSALRVFVSCVIGPPEKGANAAGRAIGLDRNYQISDAAAQAIWNCSKFQYRDLRRNSPWMTRNPFKKLPRWLGKSPLVEGHFSFDPHSGVAGRRRKAILRGAICEVFLR